MRLMYKLLVVMAAVLVLVSCASADTASNKSRKDVEKGFDKMTGGFDLVDLFTLGAFMKLCLWCMVFSALITLIGYFSRNSTLFNYGVKGFLVCIGVIVLYIAGLNIYDYGMDELFK